MGRGARAMSAKVIALVAALCAVAGAFDTDSVVSPLEDMQMMIDESSGVQEDEEQPAIPFMSKLPDPTDWSQGGDLGESAEDMGIPSHESGALLHEDVVFDKVTHDKKWLSEADEAYQASRKSLLHFEEGVKREIERYESSHSAK